MRGLGDRGIGGSGNQRKWGLGDLRLMMMLMMIFSNFCLPVAIFGKPLAIFGNLCKSLAIFCDLQRPSVIFGDVQQS